MIFVTGGTGLVGSHLLRKLVSSGKKVRATKRKTSNLRWVQDVADGIEWVEADLLDVDALHEAMDGVQQVYHSAAMISFVPKDAERMKEINVEGTANIVNMALEKEVDRLVYVSSVAAIGRSVKSKHIDEKSKWEESPINSQYAISKYLAEQEVWRGIAEGLNAVIVNPSVILGEGDWTKGSGRLFSRVKDGLLFYPNGGNSFVDVLDVVDIMVLLMNSDINNERFIVCSESLTFQAFFEKAAKVLNQKAPSIKAHPLLAQVAWRLEAIKARFTNTTPLITKETVTTSSHHYIYDNEKIKSTLNYKFRDIDATIVRVGKAFLAEFE